MSKSNDITVFRGTNREFTGKFNQIAKHFKINNTTLKNRIENMGMTLEEAIDHKKIIGKKAKIHTIFKETDQEFIGTLKEIADHFNINYKLLSARMSNNNLSIEDAINYKIIVKNKKNKTIFKGTNREFTGTLYEISNHFNISYRTLTRRIKEMNLSVEEAIDYDKIKIYTVFESTNREFNGTLKEIAKYFNIGYSTLVYRINNMGLSLEKAINYKYGEIYTCFIGTDKEFKGTLKDIAKHFNINYTVFVDAKNSFINNKNVNNQNEFFIDDIINNCLNKKLKEYTVFKGTDREFTGKLTEIYNKFNLSESAINNKINIKKFSLEEAIEIPLKRINQSNLTYKGQKGTMKELCKKFDKNYIEVYNKVKYNHTFEWAMDSTTEPYSENK